MIKMYKFKASILSLYFVQTQTHVNTQWCPRGCSQPLSCPQPQSREPFAHLSHLCSLCPHPPTLPRRGWFWADKWKRQHHGGEAQPTWPFHHNEPLRAELSCLISGHTWVCSLKNFEGETCLQPVGTARWPEEARLSLCPASNVLGMPHASDAPWTTSYGSPGAEWTWGVLYMLWRNPQRGNNLPCDFQNRQNVLF